jgi:hypothetical protein
VQAPFCVQQEEDNVDTEEQTTIRSAAESGKRSVAKHIASLILLLYVLGWAAALKWQPAWELSERASYGYQLGWCACLVACGCTIAMWRTLHRPAATPTNSLARNPSQGGDA